MFGTGQIHLRYSASLNSTTETAARQATIENISIVGAKEVKFGQL